MPLQKFILILMICSLVTVHYSSPVAGKENRVKMAAKNSPVSSAKEFVCGTYKGSEKETLWNYYQYQAEKRRLEKLGKRSNSSEFVFDDVWVIEDDGSILLSGFNPFDTDFTTFHFAPNANNGYDVSTISFNFNRSLGSNLSLQDDGNGTVNIPFTFSYYGVDWTSVHVNANGIISFGADINPSGFFNNNDFVSELPKISPYFMDLNPEINGGVFAKSESNTMTITWNQVPEFNTNNPNSIQLVLYENNSFDITFNGIATTTHSSNNTPITFGIHPGGQPNLEIIKFSENLPYNGSAGAGIFELYLDIKQPVVNGVAMMNRFYQSNPDSFFQTFFFTNFTQTMGGFANEITIKNTITGIGIGDFDNSRLYGSSGVLESRCNMNQLSVWPNDSEERFFFDGNNTLTILGQEAGHRWGAFVNFIDGNGQVSNLILGRADAHWSYYFDSDHSSLEGGNWQQLSGNSYTTPTRIDFFSDIDEYLMGLRTPEEVTPSFYLSSFLNNLQSSRDQGTPAIGASANGSAVEVKIEDIIAAEGARTPVEPAAPKDLRQAFILVVQPGFPAQQAELEKIAKFRRAWEDYFEISVDGRFTINTSITKSFPVAVVKGHVVDAVTQLPVENITVKSVERQFEQFTFSGGRYTFRYLADTNSGSQENITLIASADGYISSTLTTAINYDAELEFDFNLQPIATSVYNRQNQVPLEPVLNQNYPNPFNPTTSIHYELAEMNHVEIVIYNPMGQVVKTLVKTTNPAGTFKVEWNGRDQEGKQVVSGIYFYRIKAGSFVQVRKMVVIR